MDQTQLKLEEIHEKVTSIVRLLKGHEMNKEDMGMIGIQNDHEKRIETLEKLVEKGKWFLFGLSVPAGWGIIDIIQKIFIK